MSLKMESEAACLIWSGRTFQSLGLAMEKALSPLSFRLDLGTSRSSWSADLRHREEHSHGTAQKGKAG